MILHKLTAEEEVIRRLQEDAPVDVVAIANALGIAVWEQALLHNVSGKLFPDSAHGGAAGFSIVVNSEEPYVRRRFTVAHEIGHFLLHREQIGSGIQDDAWYRSGLPPRQEAEANRVAANILMPEHLLERYAFMSPDAMAKKFEVSAHAIEIRLGLVRR